MWQCLLAFLWTLFYITCDWSKFTIAILKLLKHSVFFFSFITFFLSLSSLWLYVLLLNWSKTNSEILLKKNTKVYVTRDFYILKDHTEKMSFTGSWICTLTRLNLYYIKKVKFSCKSANNKHIQNVRILIQVYISCVLKTQPCVIPVFLLYIVLRKKVVC